MVKDVEAIILGAWLSGEHLEDVSMFSHSDFEEYSGIALNFMSGITDHLDLVRASGEKPDIIGRLTGQYTEALYESAMADIRKDQAKLWIAMHPNATPKEIAEAMGKFTGGYVAMPEAAKEPVLDLMDEFDRRKKEPFVRTGLTILDSMLCGIRRKELTSVGARPSVGKSAFVQQVAMNVAKNGQKVLFFPLEMSTIAVTERMFMRYTNFSQSSVKRGLSQEQWRITEEDDVWGKMDEFFRDGNLLIFERCTDLRIIRELIRKHKPHMIVIDQLEQLKDGKKTFKDKRSRFSHMTHELQGMAMDENVAIWLACQVNRGADDSPPTLANLKESGTIEEDSDNVILLHREGEKETRQKIILNLAKQRNGECGSMPLAFIAPKYAFYEQEMGY